MWTKFCTQKTHQLTFKPLGPQRVPMFADRIINWSAIIRLGCISSKGLTVLMRGDRTQAHTDREPVRSHGGEGAYLARRAQLRTHTVNA